MKFSGDQILVIDPDPDEREKLAAYLSEKGYFVQTTASIAAASLLKMDAPPDLIFADIPNHQIASLPYFDAEARNVSLIVISKVEKAGDVVACLRAGADDFILKPVVDLHSVDRVILKILDQVRLANLNKRLRNELEERNKTLREGINELRADQKAGLQVQLKMLPETNKEINGFAFHHRVQPSLYLSGDFLDYFRIDTDRTLFYFADVSGHGASSAFVTVLLKNLTVRLKRNFKRNSSDEISCPARFLRRLNQELIDSDLGKHITVFAGILHKQTRRMTFSIGGHLPLPILSSQQGSEYLSAKGMAVGLFPEPEFEVREIELPDKFKLTVFSDGILEVMPEDSLKNKEKLLLDVVSKERGDIESLLTSIGLDDIDQLPDDIAVLSVSDRD